MGAGDLIVLGWNGSPAYKEVVAPSVSYEPVYNDETFIKLTKKLTRKLDCRTKDVQTIIATLSVLNNDISFDAPTSGGGTTTISYGSGWKMTSYSEAPSGNNYFSEINISYEKEIVSAFDVDIPAGLTMINDGGIGYIKYLTHTLFQFNPGVVDNGKGWQTDMFLEISDNHFIENSRLAPTGVVNSSRRINNNFDGVDVRFNGVLVKKVVPIAEDLTVGHIEYKTRLGRAVSGNLTGYNDDGSPIYSGYTYEAAVAATKKAYNIPESQWLGLVDVTSIWSDTLTLNGLLTSATRVAYTTKTINYLSGGYYFGNAGEFINYPELLWDTSIANRYTLRFGSLVIFDFDITGLS